MKIKKNIIPFLAVFLVIVIFTVSLLGGHSKEATVNGFAMGSPVSVTVYGEKKGEELCTFAIDRIKFIDNSYLSHTISESAVSVLNRDGKLISDKWFSDYLSECVKLSEKSDSFTLFSGEMKSLWKIENGGYVPTDEEIAESLENLKNSSLKIDSNLIFIYNGLLDLGALGKGTACDEAIQILKSKGIENALVTVGGTVGVMGSPRKNDSFGIGVRNPFGNQNDYFAVLNVSDCFISTSGDYEKFFEGDGVRYSHIFDAKTGCPVQNDISSVTVVADNGMLSDYLSTLLYIEGAEKAFQIAENYGAEIIVTKKDRTVLISKELEDKFALNDKSFSVTVI